MLDDIGALMFRRTGQDLVVTSSNRDFVHTTDTLMAQTPGQRTQRYSSQGAFGDYEGAFARIPGRQPGESESDCHRRQRTAALAAVNQLQNVDHRYISNHQAQDGMSSIDISTVRSQLGNRDIQYLTELFRQRGYRATDESDHIHFDRENALVQTEAHVPLTSGERLRRAAIDFAESQAQMNSMGPYGVYGGEGLY